MATNICVSERRKNERASTEVMLSLAWCSSFRTTLVLSLRAGLEITAAVRARTSECRVYARDDQTACLSYGRHFCTRGGVGFGGRNHNSRLESHNVTQCVRASAQCANECSLWQRCRCKIPLAQTTYARGDQGDTHRARKEGRRAFRRIAPHLLGDAAVFEHSGNKAGVAEAHSALQRRRVHHLRVQKHLAGNLRNRWRKQTKRTRPVNSV